MLGETHGIAETANAILSVVRRLEVNALALEWSHDEVGDVVAGVFETGRIDLDALWQVPPGGDLFAGDGRFTAGHVRLFEELVATGELGQVILVDRLDGGGAERERGMAARLVESLRPGLGVVAVVGLGHALRASAGAPDTMFTHVERALPGCANGALSFSSGRCHYHGEREVRPVGERTGATFDLGVATPAVVPAR